MSSNQSIINLESILNLSTKLNDSHDINFIYSSAILSLMGKLKVSKVCGFLLEKQEFHQVICKGSTTNLKFPLFEIPTSFSKIEKENENYQTLIENDYKYILPLRNKSDSIGFIALGQSLQNIPLTDEQIKYAEIVGLVATSSLMNSENFNKLLNEKKQVEKINILLETLMEISKDFTSFSSVRQILERFKFHLMGQLSINKYAIYLKEGRFYKELVNRFDKEIPHNFLEQLEKYSKITPAHNLKNELPTDLANCCITAISPMFYQSELKGFVLIGKKLTNGELTQENLLFIEVLSNTLITALENHRLFLEEIEKKKLENELNLALEIQKNLLPKSSPKIAGYDIEGISRPTKAVGGDYFDFIKINDKKWLIVIADVSGKGVPASLLMANLQAAIRTVAPLDLPLNSILKNINTLIFENTSPEKFITLFIAEINNQDNSFRFINAGHNPPLYINQKKQSRELSEGGLILGIIKEIEDFEQGEIKLENGDIIFCYTDGLSEAYNGDEEFGIDRIQNILTAKAQNNSNEIIEEMLKEVQSFSGEKEQYDDITMITIKKI
ncbi:MAG: PP2C family protein-serine/threonine phosphatase [Candidatus Kapaibacteriota bacterium]